MLNTRTKARNQEALHYFPIGEAIPKIEEEKKLEFCESTTDMLSPSELFRELPEHQKNVEEDWRIDSDQEVLKGLQESGRHPLFFPTLNSARIQRSHESPNEYWTSFKP